MPRYRKKPVIIEAEQWFPGRNIEGVVLHDPCKVKNEKGAIKTLEGWLTVSPGDYIITGVAGERYPCKPDIFEKTYDRVE